MTIDKDLARACQATYSSPASIFNSKTGAYVCLSRAYNGILIVAFRGSITPQDWARDFLTVTVQSKTDPTLGFCHAGFLDASTNVEPAVANAVQDVPFYITGHSLGGALAVGVATMLLERGLHAEKVVTFGAPRFGGHYFRKASAPLSITQYRYGNDPVPTVPFWVWPWFLYVDTRPQTRIGTPCDEPTKCHNINGYEGALT